MSSGSAPETKYALPPGYNANISQAKRLLSAEEQRMNQLNSAMAGLAPTAQNLIGWNPSTQDPYVRSMLDQLISKGSVDKAQFTKASTRGPEPVAVKDPGTQEDFYTVRKGSKVWRNRVTTGRTTSEGNPEVRHLNAQEIAAYQSAKQRYDDYTRNQASWNAQGAEHDAMVQNYDTYHAQAQQEFERYKQVQEQNKQMQGVRETAWGRAKDTTGIMSNLARLQKLIGEEPIGWSDAQSNLGDTEAELQRALRGEIPLDPQIARMAAEQEGLLRNRMSHQLGSGFETSSPYLDLMSKLNQARSESEFQNKEQLKSNALGRYTQSIQNLGSLGELRQRDIGSTINQLTALYANQTNALSVAGAPMATYQFQDWGGLLPTIQQLTAMPFGQSLMPMAEAYSQMAGQPQAYTQQSGGGGFAQYMAPLGMAVGGIAGSIIPGAGTMAGMALGGALGGLAGGGMSAAGYGSMMPAFGGQSQVAQNLAQSQYGSYNGPAMAGYSGGGYNTGYPTLSPYLQSRGY